MVGLARVLAAEPSLLVLDEPTNGLDPGGIRWLRGFIRSLVADGRTILLSSHLLHEVQACADAFMMMDQGHVVASGSVADISQFSSLEDLYFDESTTRAAWGSRDFTLLGWHPVTPALYVSSALIGLAAIGSSAYSAKSAPGGGTRRRNEQRHLHSPPIPMRRLGAGT